MKTKEKTIWDSLTKDFPKEALKEVTFGRRFTSLDAYHIISRLTTVFGICGTGWGLKNLEYNIVGDFESVACTGALWYKIDDTEGEVYAVGDAAIMHDKNTKKPKNIAESYKKSQTNLISKASSYIGVGLGLYQGKNLDDPYIDREHEDSKITQFKYDITDFPKENRAKLDGYLKTREVYAACNNSNLILSNQELKKLKNYQLIDLPKEDELNSLLG